MGAPRQASPPLPGPASWLAPVVLLALVAVALAAAIRLAATTANDGDSDAPTAARGIAAAVAASGAHGRGALSRRHQRALPEPPPSVPSNNVPPRA